MRYACRCTVDVVGLEPDEAVGAFVPLSSVAAFCFGMYLPAYLGGTMVSIGRWSPAAALAAMAKHRVAWTMLVPTMALQLSVTDDSEGKLSTLRAMTVGGGPMNEHALRTAGSVAPGCRAGGPRRARLSLATGGRVGVSERVRCSIGRPSAGSFAQSS